MDEKELIRTGMEVVLRPVTEVAENAIGLLGGDWLSDKRERNRKRLKSKTDNILRNRRVEQPIEPPPSIILPLLKEAQEESRETLVDIWAKLVAAAMDPGRINSYRRVYVEIARQLDAIDAIVLPVLSAPGPLDPSRREFVTGKLGIGVDATVISFQNLERLGLISNGDGLNPKTMPFLTSLGREFLALVS